MLTIACFALIKKFFFARWVLLHPHPDPVIRSMQEHGFWDVWSL